MMASAKRGRLHTGEPRIGTDKRQRVGPNVLRQLPGGFVSLTVATSGPTTRVRDLDLRAD